MARRKAGSLVALEREILDVALARLRAGDGRFHGFGLAQQLRERSDTRALTAHGTLYKALGRLEDFGLLRSHWDTEATDGRPRRRLYELTAEGARAATQARAEGPAPRVAPEPA